MFSSLTKLLWIRGAVTLVSALNLLAAPPARADVKTRPLAFRAAMLADTGKLKMPLLANGDDHSYGANLATEIGFAASDVITNSGRLIMDEQPDQAIALITSFIGN